MKKDNLINLVRKAFFIDTAIITKTDSWFLLQNSINHILNWQTFSNKSREVLSELYGNQSEIIEHVLKCGDKIDKDTNYENQYIRNWIYSNKEDKLLFICEIVTKLATERNAITIKIESDVWDEPLSVIGKQIVKKNKKKHILSDKQITVIRLKQPKAEAIIEREGIEKGKINVSFLVKGHWRNQSYINSESKERYNKLKWIDSYFKGKDKDKLQKIIEI